MFKTYFQAWLQRQLSIRWSTGHSAGSVVFESHTPFLCSIDWNNPFLPQAWMATIWAVRQTRRRSLDHCAGMRPSTIWNVGVILIVTVGLVKYVLQRWPAWTLMCEFLWSASCWWSSCPLDCCSGSGFRCWVGENLTSDDHQPLLPHDSRWGSRFGICSRLPLILCGHWQRPWIRFWNRFLGSIAHRHPNVQCNT